MTNVQDELRDEMLRAIKKHGDFNSAHEGYAVILEEMDELWDEVKKKKPSPKRMRAEALQVGAMALKFMLYCDHMV